MRALIGRSSGTTLLLIVSLAFNIGVCIALGVQQAEPRAERSIGGKGRRAHGPWRELGMSRKQSDASAEAYRALRDLLHTQREALRAASDGLADLLTAPEIDEAALEAQLEILGQVRDKTQRLMIDHFVRMRESLEPDQLDAFREMLRHRLPFGGGRPSHGRRGPRPGP